MVVNNSFDHDDANLLQTTEISIPRPVRFWLLLLLDVPSIICSFFLLFHLIINKTLRCQLTNHFIIVLLIIGLIIELIDIPFHLTFLHSGTVQPSLPITCLIWWFIDFGLYSGCTIIMAWGSIQRYLFIFHDRIFLNKTKRFIFHYFPLIILLLYIMIFYTIAVFFPPCKNTYDYMLPVCDEYPCYLSDPIFGIWDSIVNNLFATVLITIASLVLLVRVYYQKRRLHQRNLWRKQRKMTIQLLSNCILYLTPNMPFNIIVFAHLCGLSEGIGIEVQLYFDFLCYFVILLYPFVCLGTLPELRKKIRPQGLVVMQLPRKIAIDRPQ